MSGADARPTATEPAPTAVAAPVRLSGGTALRAGFVARFARLVGVEIMKVLGGKTLLMGLLAVTAVTALAAWGHDVGREDTAWTVSATALAAGLWAAEIFLLVLGTTAIAGETAQGTLKMILPHAYRRTDWICAKAFVLLAQAFVLLFVGVVAAVVGGMLRGGLSDVTQQIEATFGGEGRTVTLHSSSEMWGHLLASAGASLASLIATAWLGLLISCVFDGIVSALSTGFLLFLGFKSAGTLFGVGPDVLEDVYAWYPGEMLTRLEKLGRGLAERWNDALLADAVRLAGIVGAVSVLLSFVIFTARDLHS